MALNLECLWPKYSKFCLPYPCLCSFKGEWHGSSSPVKDDFLLKGVLENPKPGSVATALSLILVPLHLSSLGFLPGWWAPASGRMFLRALSFIVRNSTSWWGLWGFGLSWKLFGAASSSSEKCIVMRERFHLFKASEIFLCYSLNWVGQCGSGASWLPLEAFCHSARVLLLKQGCKQRVDARGLFYLAQGRTANLM